MHLWFIHFFQKNKKENIIPSTQEVTAFVKKNKTKKISGSEDQRAYVMGFVIEMYIEVPSNIGKITFKVCTRLFNSFCLLLFNLSSYEIVENVLKQ